MKITRAAEYAVRCTYYLAWKGNDVIVNKKEVAGQMDIPEQFLTKIAQQLAKQMKLSSENSKKSDKITCSASVLIPTKEQVNKEIEEKNKSITDSIQYSKRIQSAFLTSNEYLTKVLSNHFIFYKPKDIVSGDFYWFGAGLFFTALSLFPDQQSIIGGHWMVIQQHQSSV